MKVSLRAKFFISFTIVIIFTGIIATWIGIHFIGVGILREAQKRVEMDLNAAREIYRKEIHDICLLVRLVSNNIYGELVNKRMSEVIRKLEDVKVNEGLDILTLVDDRGTVFIRTRNPRIAGDIQINDEIINEAIRQKKAVASTQIISKEELLKEGEDIVEQSHIKIISTPKAKPIKKEYETSGMIIKAVSPIIDEKGNVIGILYGGNLLNQNNKIVDKVANTVFKGEVYKDKEIGAATIFQGDLRISTNVKNNEGNRAIGTQISEEVSNQVLGRGKSWIARAFVVNDWYISAYEPIRNIKNEVIGILYVGILEKKYMDLKRRTLIIFLGLTLAGVIASLIIAYLLSNGIIEPVKKLVFASKRFADGNLEARVECNSNDELGELGKAFNSMASAIMDRDKELRKRAQEEIMKSERLAMIGQLAAGVAHEINNPLGSILLFTRLLLKKPLPEDIFKNNLERIEKDVKRCQNIVQGLLEFARKREPRIETINVKELLEKTINLFEKQPMFHNIEIIKQYQADVPIVSVDPSQIQQVFVNIILNAVDAMEKEGKLIIKIYCKDSDNIEISFIDTGCGISPDNIGHIFEPFFTTKCVGHGTGLGLSISYGIIQRHGGDLTVSSYLGKGSTFIIRLPISKKDI